MLQDRLPLELLSPQGSARIGHRKIKAADNVYIFGIWIKFSQHGGWLRDC